MKATFYRWWLLFSLICLGGAFSWDVGYIMTIYQADVTFLSAVIGFLFVLTTVLIGWRTWLFSYRDTYTDTHLGKEITKIVMALGMFGTLIGFTLVFGESLTNLNFEDNASKAKVLAEMGIGIKTAIYTSLSGLAATILIWVQLMNLEYGIARYEDI